MIPGNDCNTQQAVSRLGKDKDVKFATVVRVKP